MGSAIREQWFFAVGFVLGVVLSIIVSTFSTKPVTDRPYTFVDNIVGACMVYRDYTIAGGFGSPYVCVDCQEFLDNNDTRNLYWEVRQKIDPCKIYNQSGVLNQLGDT